MNENRIRDELPQNHLTLQELKIDIGEENDELYFVDPQEDYDPEIKHYDKEVLELAQKRIERKIC